VVACLVARTAHADGDERPGDRFFFGLYGGMTSGGGAGGYEVSAWPDDYIGILAGTSVVTAGPLAGEVPDSTSFDFGGAFVGAVPLRYVQPYAGVWGGFVRSTLAGNGTDFHSDWHPLVGMNAYVARNLRLYVQWRPATVHRGMDTLPDPETDLYTFGVRWSPEAFHSARSVNKVDLVWGSVVLSCAVWGFINLMQYGSGN